MTDLTDIRFSTILQRSRAALAGTAHPRFRQISNMARKILDEELSEKNESQRESVPSGGLLNEDHVRDEYETWGSVRMREPTKKVTAPSNFN
jgi:hypothetical protein